MTIRYEARGKVVIATLGSRSVPEQVGMFCTEQLAVLAAAGMNAVTREAQGQHVNLNAQLTPRRDFRPPSDWPTQFLPPTNRT